MDKNDIDRNTATDLLEVKDLSISAFLFSLNHVKLIGKRRLSTGEILFQFTPKAVAEKLIGQYWRLEAPNIQPKILFNSLRNMKDMIFAG